MSSRYNRWKEFDPCRSLFRVVIVCSVVFGAAAAALPEPSPIPLAGDFQLDGQWAKKHNMAILVLVTREDCRHCALLKREVLGPMVRSGDYNDKVLIRELVTQPRFAVIDFQGKTSNTANIAGRHGVKVTPTVLLLDADGKPLHPPIVGINSTDFYGYYLDQAIETALSRISDNSSGQSGQRS